MGSQMKCLRNKRENTHLPQPFLSTTNVLGAPSTSDLTSYRSSNPHPAPPPTRGWDPAASMMYGSRLPPVVRGGHALNHNFARDSVDDTVVPKDKMSQTVPLN